MVCTTLGSLLRPLFYFQCSILLIHRVMEKKIFLYQILSLHTLIMWSPSFVERGSIPEEISTRRGSLSAVRPSVQQRQG